MEESSMDVDQQTKLAQETQGETSAFKSVDLGVNINHRPLYEGGFAELSKRLKPIVWVLKMTGKIGAEDYESYFTAFSVGKVGLAMTCAHGWSEMSGLKIEARRLNEVGFNHTADIDKLNRRWDLALLRISDVSECVCGEFAVDGSLNETETILHVGHPGEFVGSLPTGHVVFECTEEVTLPTGFQTCGNYVSEAMAITPPYRIMGHIWNARMFNGIPLPELAYERNLHPLIPIIQCNGVTGGKGTSGGPIFNTRGEIVGMLISEADGYQVAIHVTLLREFLKVALEDEKPSVEGDSKGKAQVPVGVGSSKKREGAKKRKI